MRITICFIISLVLASYSYSSAHDNGCIMSESAVMQQLTSPTYENLDQNDKLPKDLDKELRSKDNECFVKGVSNYKLYKPIEDKNNKGITFNYKGRDLKVYMFEYQIGLFAQLVDESGEKMDLGFDDILVVTDGDFGFDDNYKDWEYVITQYDIDSDGKDEIIIASRINDGMSTPVGVFVYRIKDGKTWNLKAPQTWGDMNVKLVNNHVKVEPNHYGFIYDWAFENDGFVDRGKY